MQPAEQGGKEARQVGLGQPLEAELAGLDVGQVEEGGVGGEGRDRRRLADLQVGNVDVLGDDERRRAHDRRHDLAVDSGRHLDRGGLLRRVADLLHQRNGEGAAGHHVGDGRPRHHAGQAARQDRRLGRPPLVAPEQAHRQVDEETSGAGPLQQGAEEDEEKDDARRDVERDAEDPLGGQRDLADVALHARPAKSDKIGHVRAEEDVQGKDHGDRRQRRAHDPPRPLQQNEDERPADQQVAAVRHPDPRGDPLVVEDDVEGGEGGDQRQQQVHHRHRVLLPQPAQSGNLHIPLEGRIGEEDQRQGEGQVDGADVGRIEEQPARQGELEQGPAQRHRRHQVAVPALGAAQAEFLLFLKAARRQFAVVRHRVCLLHLASSLFPITPGLANRAPARAACRFT